MSYKYKILSIDGGGIRGMIPAIVLTEIERRTGKSIAELFDFIAGTSTGGILALGLTKPHPKQSDRSHYKAEDLVNLYRTEGKRIFREAFPGRTDEWLFNPKHRSEGKDQVLTEFLEATPLKLALKEVFITSYDTQLRKPIFFTSNPKAEQLEERGLHEADNFRKICTGFTMKQAAMSTSAAPTFFEPYKIETVHHNTPHGYYSLVDGAVYANNPTLLATLEARMSHFRNTGEELHLKDILIVSLGTGSLTTQFPYQEVRNWGKLQWIQPFINIVFDGQSEAIDSQLGSFLHGSGAAQHYHRFQVDLNGSETPMDDVREENLRSLETLAKRLIEQRDMVVQELCDKLIGSVPVTSR